MSWQIYEKITHLRKVSDALKENKSITHLNLSSNPQIKNKGLEALSYILSSVINLKLSYNQINPEGALVLSEALKDNQSLVYLDLSNNQLQQQGIQAILTALQSNISLVSLDISSNNIGDLGAQALFALLKDNKTIAILNIQNNNITDKGAKYIADLLVENLFLSYLEFMGNNLQQQGAALISDALKMNSTVIKFNGNTNLSDAISIKITKNNQLLQEKLKDLVNPIVSSGIPLAIGVEPINQSSKEKNGCSAHLATSSRPVYALASFTAAETAVEPFFVNLTISTESMRSINSSAASNSIKDWRVRFVPFRICLIAASSISSSAYPTFTARRPIP